MLRERLAIKPEFKFSKTKFDYRDIFFKEMSEHHFKIRALVVKKTSIYSEKLRGEKSSFYNYFLKMLIKHDAGILHNASIKIDGSGDAVFQQALQSYLRKELKPNQLKKLKFVDSKTDNLVQLADMVVGAIARSCKDNRQEAQRWRKMLSKQIDDIWDFA